MTPLPATARTLIVRLHRTLTDRTTPVGPYILKAALVTSVPVALATAFAAWLGLVQLRAADLLYAWPIPSTMSFRLGMGLMDILVLSPLVETGLALLPIWILRKCRIRDAFIPAIAGIFWGAIHMRGGSGFAFIQAWPFYCFTMILMTHEKPSVDRAWIIGSAVHGVNNVITFAMSAACAEY